MSSIVDIGVSKHVFTPIKNLTDRYPGLDLSHEIFETYVERSDNITNMMEEAILDVLNRSSIAASEIDAVFFASETFDDPSAERLSEMTSETPKRKAARNSLIALAHDVGLVNAMPLGFWLLDCDTASEALLYAHRCVEDSRFSKVIVLTGERWTSSEMRVAEDNAVWSDVITAVLITSEKKGLSLNKEARVLRPYKYYSPPEDVSFKTMQGIKQLRKKFEFVSEKRLKDFTLKVFGNWPRDWTASAASQLGLSTDEIWEPTVRSFSHAHGSDLFLNLRYALDNGGLAVNDDVFIFSPTPLVMRMISFNFIG